MPARITLRVVLRKSAHLRRPLSSHLAQHARQVVERLRHQNRNVY
jgi:hypothetical protein